MPIIQSAPAVTQAVRTAPQSGPWLHRSPVAQSAPVVQQQMRAVPAVTQPMRAAPPAQWHRAPIVQSEPVMRSMPAPQARASERGFGHSFGGAFRATAGGGGGGGARSSGGRHKG
jgi:hypothetical protein